MHKNLFLKCLLVLIPVGMALMPLAASAAVTAPNIWPTGYWGTNPLLLSCYGNYLASADASKSCTSLDQLLQTFVNIIYFAMSVALFVVAPILFLVGAIMIIFAGASPDMITKGRQTLIGTAIGIVIVLCSYLIVNTVIGVFHITGITGFGGS